MSRIISSLLLSMSMFPAAFGVFLTVAVLVDEIPGVRNSAHVAIGSLVAMLFVYAYWTLVWRSSVRWSRRRMIGTFVALLGSLSLGAVVMVIMAAYIRGSYRWALGITFGAMATATMWMIISSLVWRESASERDLRLEAASATAVCVLLCPKCGYSMAGLTHARCPECGTEYTLDALLAANLERTEPERDLTGAGR